MPGGPLGLRVGRSLGTSVGYDMSSASGGGTTPADIIPVASRRGWFRSDQGITLNGDRVSQWDNIWGNGHLVQATAANQPLFTASHAAFNNHPALTCDDGQRPMYATLTTGLVARDYMYMWCFGQLTSAPLEFNYFCMQGHSSNPRVAIGTSTSGAWRWVSAPGSGVSIDAQVGTADTVPHLFELAVSSTATIGAISGVSIGGGPGTVTNGTGTQLYIFGLRTSQVAESVYGHIAEVVSMSREPSLLMKQRMREYFLARYGTI